MRPPLDQLQLRKSGEKLTMVGATKEVARVEYLGQMVRANNPGLHRIDRADATHDKNDVDTV